MHGRRARDPHRAAHPHRDSAELEDLAHKLAGVMRELGSAGIAVKSISHAVDTSSVEARFSALVFGETRFP
jgi:predicted secreted protein